LWQYEIGSGAWATIGDFANEFSNGSSSGGVITPISLTSIAALKGLAAGTSVKFRIVPYGATSTGGTWYVYAQTPDDLKVSGIY
jgi:hypothetical protein